MATMIERMLGRLGFTRTAVTKAAQPTTRQFQAIAAYSPTAISSPVVAENILQYAMRHPYYNAALNHIATAAIGVPLNVSRLLPAGNGRGVSKIVTVAEARYIQRHFAGIPQETRGDWLQRKSVQAEELYDHPLRTLFDTVNEFMTWRELCYLTLFHLRACGDAYWEIVGDKEPVALYPMNPSRVRIKPSKERWIDSYVHTVNGIETPYEPEQVLHFRLPHPDNDYYGLASGAVLERVLKAEWDRLDYTVGMFENGLQIGGTLVPKSELGVDEGLWQRQVDAFNKAHRGAKNANKVAAMQDATFVPMQWSPKDAEYLGMAGRHDQEISTVLGVPTQLFKAENVNRANYEAAQLQFWSDTMIPLLSLVAGQINEFLAVRYGPDIVCEFDTSVVAALQEDLAPQAARAKDGWESGVVSADEYRAAQGLDALDGGKGSVFLRKPGLKLVSLADFDASPEPLPVAPPPAAGADTLADREQDEPPLPPGPSQEAKSAWPLKVLRSRDAEPTMPRRSSGKFGDERHGHIWKAFDARAAEREAILAREIAQWAKGLEEATLARLDKTKAFRVTRAAPEAILFDVDEQGEALWKIVKGSALATLLAEGNATLAEIAVWWPDAAGFNFTDADPAVLEYLENKASKVKTVAENLHGDLKQLLADGEREGKTIAQLTEELAGRFGDLQDWQAERIARTEIVGAQNTGSGIAIDSVDLPSEWIATLDDKVRDSHAAMHGLVTEPGEVFPNGLRWPGDDLGDAAEVINCRCTVVAILPGEEEAM